MRRGWRGWQLAYAQSRRVGILRRLWRCPRSSRMLRCVTVSLQQHTKRKTMVEAEDGKGKQGGKEFAEGARAEVVWEPEGVRQG